MLKKPQTVAMFGLKPNLSKKDSSSSKLKKQTQPNSNSSSIGRTTYHRNKKSYDSKVREKFIQTSRFAPIENLDICNPIGKLPNMTLEESAEATKNMLNIFDIKSKKGRPLTGNKTLTQQELNTEIQMINHQAKRLSGTSNISWYMNKTARDPIQEQIATLGYYKPKPTRASNSINEGTTTINEQTNDQIKLEKLMQSINIFDSKSRQLTQKKGCSSQAHPSKSMLISTTNATNEKFMSKRVAELEESIFEKQIGGTISPRSCKNAPIMSSTIYDNFLEELKIRRWQARNQRTHNVTAIKETL